MTLGWWFLVAGCETPEAAESAEASAGRDLILAARAVFAGCTSRTRDEGEVVNTTTWDAWGWEVEDDDGDGPYGSTTTYEREGERVISSVRIAEDGDTDESTYDPHEHVNHTVSTYNDGTQVDPTTWELEHDGEVLRQRSYTLFGTQFTETLDGCENALEIMDGDEVLLTGEWEYERGCLPSRSVVDVPMFGFVQTSTYEAGRQVHGEFTGDLDGVFDVVWDCP